MGTGASVAYKSMPAEKQAEVYEYMKQQYAEGIQKFGIEGKDSDFEELSRQLEILAPGTKDPYFDLILNEDLKKNEWPSVMAAIQADDSHKSLMSQCITEELFNKWKDHRTKTAGWSIARAINTGVQYPSSFVGIHAGDAESYHDFKEIFYPVVEKYHDGFKMDSSRHVTDLDPSKITRTLTDAAQAKIVSTRIRVARNLSMFPLNPGGTRKTREEIIDLMEKVFGTLEGDLAGKLYRHTTMTDEERQQLVDDHFLFRGKDKMQAASGYHEHWPHGRGIFLSADKKFLLWLNEGDHIRIISMQQGGDVLETFTRLQRGIAAIEASVKSVTGTEDAFMTHEVLGCITCCPSNLGTGMRGSVHIMVPRLIAKHGLGGIDKMCRERNCQARGSSGEHSEVIDRIDVSNWRRLGFPEYQLVDDMVGTVNMLSEMEDALVAEEAGGAPVLKTACTCGNLKAQLTGAPLASCICHCAQCRKVADAPSAHSAIFKQDQVAVSVASGESVEAETIVHKVEGQEMTLTSCKRCGTELFHTEKLPGMLVFSIYQIANSQPGRGMPASCVATIHTHAQEAVLPLPADGLPKYKDVPEAFGGTGILLDDLGNDLPPQ